MNTRDRDLALARKRHPLKDESGREGYADGCEHTRELIAAVAREQGLVGFAALVRTGEYLPADAEQGGR